MREAVKTPKDDFEERALVAREVFTRPRERANSVSRRGWNRCLLSAGVAEPGSLNV